MSRRELRLHGQPLPPNGKDEQGNIDNHKLLKQKPTRRNTCGNQCQGKGTSNVMDK